MKLNDLINEDLETKEQFLDRVWVDFTMNWNKRIVYVYVYDSPSQINNPNFEPKKWSLDQARRYIQQLKSEEKPKLMPEPKVEPEPEGELVKISWESIGEEPDRVEWWNSWTGKVVHRFGGE